MIAVTFEAPRLSGVAVPTPETSAPQSGPPGKAVTFALLPTVTGQPGPIPESRSAPRLPDAPCSSQAPQGAGGAEDPMIQIQTDIHAVMRLFYQLQQQLRKTAREQREGELQERLATMDRGIAAMREAADKQYTSALVSAIVEIAVNSISAVVSTVCAAKSFNLRSQSSAAYREFQETARPQLDRFQLGKASADRYRFQVQQTMNLAEKQLADATSRIDSSLKILGYVQGAIEGGTRGAQAGFKAWTAYEDHEAKMAEQRKATTDREAESHRAGEDKAKEQMDEALAMMRDLLQKMGQMEDSALQTTRNIIHNI